MRPDLLNGANGFKRTPGGSYGIIPSPLSDEGGVFAVLLGLRRDRLEKHWMLISFFSKNFFGLYLGKWSNPFFMGY